MHKLYFCLFQIKDESCTLSVTMDENHAFEHKKNGARVFDVNESLIFDERIKNQEINVINESRI